MRAKIAILGATSHIAKNLAEGFSSDRGIHLDLYARSSEKTAAFIRLLSPRGEISVRDFGQFRGGEQDVVINCVGLGAPNKVLSAGAGIFRINDTYDDLALGALENDPGCRYIYLSSGAVFGKEFEKPADAATVTHLRMNDLGAKDFYSLAKIHSEAKHRALSSFPITDIRIFSFFSRFIDLDDRFFLSEVLRSVIIGKPFVTNPVNIVRDYIHPKDLCCLVKKTILAGPQNSVLDAYSKKPVTKFEILEYFKSEYRLNVVIQDEASIVNSSGRKDLYYSENRKAAEIGYEPEFSSMDAVIDGARILIDQNRSK